MSDALFIEPADQDPKIPTEFTGPCECGCSEQETGFGLAGGGYGTYGCCAGCGKILWKRQDTGDE